MNYEGARGWQSAPSNMIMPQSFERRGEMNSSRARSMEPWRRLQGDSQTAGDTQDGSDHAFEFRIYPFQPVPKLGSERRRELAPVVRKRKTLPKKRMDGLRKSKSQSILHMLPPCETETGHERLWETWKTSIHEEPAEMKSSALQSLERLSRARVLSSTTGHPNDLRVAVALQCIDDIIAKKSPFANLLQEVKRELVLGIYKNPVNLEGNVSNCKEGAAENSLPKVPGEQYRGQSTYFEDCAVLEMERSDVLHLSLTLKDALEQWETGGQGSGKGGDDDNAWSQLIAMRNHEQKVASLLAVVSRAHDTFSRVAGSSIRVDKAKAALNTFQCLQDEQKVQFAKDVLFCLTEEQRKEILSTCGTR